MKSRWKHYLMCSPMIVLALVLLATGSVVPGIIALAAGIMMLAVMGSAMNRASGPGPKQDR